MMRRILLIAGVLVLALAVPASAQTYGSPGITTSAPLTPGATVTISACCYVPGTTVTFTLSASTTGQLSAPLESNGLYIAALHGQATQTYTATARADGVASVTVTVPANIQAGTATVSASGTPIPGSGTPANNSVDLPVGTSSGGAATGGLPVTGTTESTLPLSLFAVLLLAAGAAALLISRRRNLHDADGNGGSPAA